MTFTLEFTGKEGVLGMELQGASWEDAYSWDILETHKMNMLFGLISLQKEMKVLNSNGGLLAKFSLSGGENALADFVRCTRN